MKATELNSASVWLESPRPRFSILQRDATFDVVVVGGGITGLTAAWLLKQAGKTVAILEKGRIGDAETGHTTAHLTAVTDLRLKSIAASFGKDAAEAVWDAGTRAIDLIEETIRRLEIDCHFQRVPGYLHAALTKERNEEEELREELELAQELGIEAAFVHRAPVVRRPAIRFADQALFHPMEYLSGLARAIEGDGCRIFECCEANNFDDEPLAVTANDCAIRCDRLIIATHVPLMGLSSLPSATLRQTKLAGYTTYAIGANVTGQELPVASFWDTDDPYYYLRVDRRSSGNYVIFGGQDHKTGQHDDPEARYAELESVLRGVIPDAEVDHRWSGQVIETNDGLPFIGPTTEKQFVATGFSGNGMTFGTLSGVMAADWVLGRKNPWQELFEVSRSKIRGGLWDYLKENVDYPTHLVKGYLKTPDAPSVEEVPAGEGRIVKIDGKRCAVHRTDVGEIRACSAICTHMGCVVRWNGAEKSWDCPCHGSRFGTDGHVMAGPAETALEKIDSVS